jgi:hypothetical protein
MSQLQVNRINDASGGVLAPISSVMRNRIQNGAMVIDQRNAGASVTPNNTYTLDRWIVENSQTSKLTVQQNAGSVTPPNGFRNYLGVTSTAATSVGSGDYFMLEQRIEGFNMADLMWGTANAKTVTLSFWVRSSLTGTFGGSLMNGTNGRAYPFTYTISAANTWEYETITIAGDTTGTWFTTNGTGILLSFGLGVGSTYSGTAGAWTNGNLFSATGATSVVGTNGATFYITGVQLEVGTQATSFEYRQYGTELALCQRYFQISKASEGTTNYTSFCNGHFPATTYGFFQFPLVQAMRTAPTLSNNTVSQYRVGFNTCTALAISSGNPVSVSIRGDTTGLTIGQGGQLDANNNTTAFIGLSAEL